MGGKLASCERTHGSRSAPSAQPAEEVDQTWRRCRPTKELVELRNMVQVAALVVKDASAQHENRGLHYNADLIAATRESTP